MAQGGPLDPGERLRRRDGGRHAGQDAVQPARPGTCGPTRSARAGAQQRPTGSPRRFRYARANLISRDANSAAWHCVYPGPYDLSAAGGKDGPFHHNGLVEVSPGFPDPSTGDNGNFGNPKAKYNGTPTPNSGNSLSGNATYDTRPIQINNRDSAGPNRPYTDTGRRLGRASASNRPAVFPFGGFARNGDLLQVPFIGGYRISADPTGRGIIELNSVTMDSVMAQFLSPQTTSTTADPFGGLVTSYDAGLVDRDLPFHNEQIGHFCPMDNGDQAHAFPAFDAPGEQSQPVDLPLGQAAVRLPGRLHAAGRLPAERRPRPHVDAGQRRPVAGPGASTTTTWTAGKPQASPPPRRSRTARPRPRSSQANFGREDTAAIEGLINSTRQLEGAVGRAVLEPDDGRQYAQDNVIARRWRSSDAATRARRRTTP